MIISESESNNHGISKKSEYVSPIDEKPHQEIDPLAATTTSSASAPARSQLTGKLSKKFGHLACNPLALRLDAKVVIKHPQNSGEVSNSMLLDRPTQQGTNKVNFDGDENEVGPLPLSVAEQKKESEIKDEQVLI
ncbi:hypothetical protein RFI_21856 [Reticulomyxa filosa]|uniref:Uncharacterized protein n=1 Tax=Reticulomyxa filosa TaxID=46433 RepID=X6MND7_RETFI|nr:hypothetical protein RFI_21856 [Reticulomyxa filosa]|eukprot:ETO15508.1 hypothetical protein RFI_21856 [Reticulomyxa filosa]